MAFTLSRVPPIATAANPMVWMLWILDFLMWAATVVGPIKAMQFFLKGAESTDLGDCVRRRTGEEKVMLTEPAKGMKTPYDMFRRAVAVFGKEPCMGTRKYLGEHKGEKDRFPKKMFGETEWINYDQASADIHNFGSALIALGMKPAPEGSLEKVDGAHTILIYEDTCAQWTQACMGAFSQSIAVATSYATLGEKCVAEAVQECKVAVLVCNQKQVPKMLALASTLPTLKAIVYCTASSLETDPKPQGTSAVRVLSFEEALELGAKNPAEPTPPSPDHMGLIMYTSGSTGKPKGVMNKHSAIAATAAGLQQVLAPTGLGLDRREVYLAYLPAAHILEFMAEMLFLSVGAALGYSDPRTISSNGAVRKRPDGTINDKPEYPYPPGGIQEFSPTVMAAVPKIWDILKKGVEDNLSKRPWIVQQLFQAAFSARALAVSQGRDTPLFNQLVFKKLKNMLGGRLTGTISGGGPISSDVQSFIRTAFCMPLVQGYALTETCCAGTVQSFGDPRDGIVGPPLGCIEIKLADCVSENNEPAVLDRRQKPYLSTDLSHYGKPCAGRGEVWIRGPSVSVGYYNQPEKTKEAFRPDGWFRTGDIAVWSPDGCLQIVDRLKNLVKLKGGEYIAVESMEKEYATSTYVNGITGGIMCYGDGDMDRPVALVQANVAILQKWAKAEGIDCASDEALCENPKVNKLVLDDLNRAGKAGELGSNELLVAIVLIAGSGSPTKPEPHSPWTPENGGLTASNKLNRKPVEAMHAKQLAAAKLLGIR